jgi:hypothetical protein
MGSSFIGKSVSLVTPGSQRVSALSASLHQAKQERAQEDEALRRASTTSLPGFKGLPSVSMDVGADMLPNGSPTIDDEGGEELKGLAVSFEKKMVIPFGARSMGTIEEGRFRSLFRFNDMQAPPSI